MKIHWLILLFAVTARAAVCAAAETAPPAVAYPGSDPGPAHADERDGRVTLGNAALSASWQWADGVLRPAELASKPAGATYDQTGAELFRLATQPPAAATGPATPRVAIRWTADRVVAAASSDGVDWRELASFPRSEFSGQPKLIRVGKMNDHGQAVDNADKGSTGEADIYALTPPPPANPTGRIHLSGPAHAAAVTEYPCPADCSAVSCRVDKGTDQGMTWGPAVAAIWDDGRRFLVVGSRDGKSTFNVETVDGQRIVTARLTAYPRFDLPASSFRLAGAPRVVRLTGRPDGVRLADRIDGEAVEATLASTTGIVVHWRAELRDGSNYVRQTAEVTSPDKTVPLTAVELADLRVPGLATVGTCPGCPVAGGGLFAGVEIPGAENAVSPAGARIGFGCKLAVSPGQSYTFGQVVGVWPDGQLRRSFLHYVERERARPSRPFLNYNCWYDLGFGVSEATLLDAATAFHRELVERRGVPVQSYLVDDGWDDVNRGLWAENAHKFPGGLPKLGRELDALGSHLGVWISPLGGYGGAPERTADARKMGIIPAAAELDLSYPGYKQWFQDRCTQLMRESGVNAFKWDRAGDGVTPHFMALLDVAHHLRAVNPDVFINVTVGTWPSPFWLNHIDTTWRNGTADVGWAGKGNDPGNPVHGRERWITFRDGSTRACFTVPSPLYPLNSVMLHGIVNGRHFQGKDVGKSGPDLRHEARSYFATGAMLQELYLTPSMMNAQAWDDVADAAKWAHANADVLTDAHWVGGDPLKLQPYGYAAWNGRKATLMLRNPDDRPQTIGIDPAVAFELPPGAATRYRLSSPYPDAPATVAELAAGRTEHFTLQPFEVLVMDATPVR
jgi:hypothetical protein